MRSDVVIQTSGLGKAFELYRRPTDRAKQFLLGKRGKYFEEFWAVRDVNLEIRRGEILGIIGRNGAGKSTLLQLICGIVAPTSGTLTVEGKIAAMLALGAGFAPELSGRENVYITATVLGLSSAEIRKRFDAIADFAGIGPFIDQPLRHYSTGMQARLAFAISIHVDADILVIDEALAVGDAAFGAKCMRFIRDFQTRGTILLVSHDLSAVANVCNRAIFIDRGSIRADGSPANVIHDYVSSTYAAIDTGGTFRSGVGQEPPDAGATADGHGGDGHGGDGHGGDGHGGTQLNPNAPWFGTRGATIVDVAFIDSHKRPLTLVRGGEQVLLRISARAERDLALPIVGFIIHDRMGQEIFVGNTFLSHAGDPVRISAGSTFVGEFGFAMPSLKAGQYSFCVSVAEGTQDHHTQHHWINSAVLFEAAPTKPVFGVFTVPMPLNRIRLVNDSQASSSDPARQG
jgi:lipopolysaccharide transport system ATP-binding protein